MLTRCIPILLVLTSPVLANQIVSAGEDFAFAAPHPPYDPDKGLTLELTLGCGSPANTIGEGVWFSAPGVLDLSSDPGIVGFLEHATNGLDDPMYVTIADSEGYESLLAFTSGNWEWMFLGQFPDLSSLEITGIQLRVYDVFIGDPANGGSGGTRVRWEFLGVPEPSSIIALALVGVLFGRRRQGRNGRTAIPLRACGSLTCRAL